MRSVCIRARARARISRAFINKRRREKERERERDIGRRDCYPIDGCTEGETKKGEMCFDSEVLQVMAVKVIKKK